MKILRRKWKKRENKEKSKKRKEESKNRKLDSHLKRNKDLRLRNKLRQRRMKEMNSIRKNNLSKHLLYMRRLSNMMKMKWYITITKLLATLR